MPQFGYSFVGFDQLTQVRASGREVDVSPKATREVCQAIKGKSLEEAKRLLEDVIAKKVPVPFKRYKGKSAHRRSLIGFHAGGYPVRAAQEVLDVVKNLEANAEFKGLSTDKLQIIHAAALRGRVVKGYVPRAFGRSSPSFNTLVHIELVAREV